MGKMKMVAFVKRADKKIVIRIRLTK